MLAVVALSSSDAERFKSRAELILSLCLRIVAALVALYVFMLGLDMMGSAFLVLGGKGAGKLLGSTGNPVKGLMVGIMATVLVQSSSTSTSIVVALVGAGQISVRDAVPVVFGANVGTSVTNTIVSMAHATSRTELEYAFSGATVHDFFNILTVLVLLPIEASVAAITGQGGPLLYISRVATEAVMGAPGSDITFSSPAKLVVAPLADVLINPSKDVLKAVSLGAPPRFTVPSSASIQSCPPTMNCAYYFCVTTPMRKAWEKLDPDGLASLTRCSSLMAFDSECWVTEADCYLGADKFYSISVEGGRVLKSGMLARVSDIPGGVIGLVLSFLLITGALFCLVKILHSIVMGRAQKLILRATQLNDYVAMFTGFAVTFVVQSSSVTTSALIPLCAIGILPVHKMLPLTLGANIGTTTTAMLVALALLRQDSLQIAFCHLFFNLLGILIWFPLPLLRDVPVKAACFLGFYASCWRLVPLLYVLLVFLAFPGLCLSISLTYESSVVVGAIMTSMLVMMLAVFMVWWWMGGCYKVVSIQMREEWAVRRARELTRANKRYEEQKAQSARSSQTADLRQVVVDSGKNRCDAPTSPANQAAAEPKERGRRVSIGPSKEATEAFVPAERVSLSEDPDDELVTWVF